MGKRLTFLVFNFRRNRWASLGGDSAPPGDSLELSEVWQGDGVTRSSAQRAGGEGLPFPTHPGTTADVKESDPLQDIAVVFHDRSWQRAGTGGGRTFFKSLWVSHHPSLPR